MLTGSEMARVDENAEALGVPREQLMESSGHALARTVREVADPGADVAVVAGRGNNGGDAFVAVRFLEDYEVVTHLLGRPETITTNVARENWDALQAADYETSEVRDSTALDLGDPDVVVDAMLGTGVSGPLREPAATAARAINEASDGGATVVSVDVPSGLDAETGDLPDVHVEADHVVTFHDVKPGLADLDAAVTVADIGIPGAAELFVGPGDRRGFTREDDAHKGDHGEVLVVGGGPYTGAPALSAQAALRAGADLARVACPAAVAREVQAYEEGLIVRSLEGDHLAPRHVDEVAALAADHDAVVVGPGLGDAPETQDAVADVLETVEGTAVVDADALAVVPEVETAATLVCTPHQGELRGMGGPAADDWRERADAVAAFAAELGHVLLVKGAHDVVSDGETTRVNRTGNPAMTTGGTGDVLAGVTGALACGHPPVGAAAVGANVTGRAGDSAVEQQDGYGLLATDLLDHLPAAIWEGAT
jgi:NAD(P)H-hydrate epimerase